MTCFPIGCIIKTDKGPRHGWGSLLISGRVMRSDAVRRRAVLAFAALLSPACVCGAVGSGSRAALRSPLGCPPHPLPCGGCALARVRGARGRGSRVVAALLRCLRGGASALVFFFRARNLNPLPRSRWSLPPPRFPGRGLTLRRLCVCLGLAAAGRLGNVLRRTRRRSRAPFLGREKFFHQSENWASLRNIRQTAVSHKSKC